MGTVLEAIEVAKIILSVEAERVKNSNEKSEDDLVESGPRVQLVKLRFSSFIFMSIVYLILKGIITIGLNFLFKLDMQQCTINAVDIR